MRTQIEDKLVELILYRADDEWSEYWLNIEITSVFEEFNLKTIQDIVPFYNELAHYAAKNIATDDGSVPLNQIYNLVEEMLGDMENAVWDKAFARLVKRHGDPKDPI